MQTGEFCVVGIGRTHQEQWAGARVLGGARAAGPKAALLPSAPLLRWVSCALPESCPSLSFLFYYSAPVHDPVQAAWSLLVHWALEQHLPHSSHVLALGPGAVRASAPRECLC